MNKERRGESVVSQEELQGRQKTRKRRWEIYVVGDDDVLPRVVRDSFDYGENVSRPIPIAPLIPVSH